METTILRVMREVYDQELEVRLRRAANLDDKVMSFDEFIHPNKNNESLELLMFYVQRCMIKYGGEVFRHTCKSHQFNFLPPRQLTLWDTEKL